ncbi:MAG: 50S ribosomal protein L22 [Acidimicrobiales bacterium]|jgi:large subunit ribosomal protein L22
MTGVKTNERPGTRAVLRHSRVSAYKAREVLNLIRGQDYERATEILEFCDRGVAEVIGKLLNSAAANARHNEGLDPEEMYVSACFADEGTTLKRWRPRARGRATRIRKRTCHITVILSRLPDEQLARRRARVAAEQSERRARRIGGGLRRARVAASTGAGRKGGEETESTTEALAALEEARALETTSHHQELEAEAESALEHEEHDHEDADDLEVSDEDDTTEADQSADVTDETSDDEAAESAVSDVEGDEAEVSPPQSSGDGADADNAADEEN